MKIDQLKRILAGGQITKVRFVKRTNGQERVMICRTGVRKGVQGAERPYDPDDYGLVTVYDMQLQAFRNIPADAVIEVKSGERRYVSGQH